MRTSHVVLANSHRPPSRDARRVRDIPPNTRVEVTVTVRAPDLPADLPSQPLTPEAFANQYGAKPEDVKTVASVLRHFGLSIDQVMQAGRSIHVSGTAAAIEAAFNANLGIYHHAKQGEFRGREGELHVPAELYGIVTGVFGLDQRRVAHRKVTAMAAAPLAPLTPADLEKHYNFPANPAEGQVIAVAEFGEPLSHGAFLPPVYVPEDVEAFCKKFDRPLSKIHVVPVNIVPLTLHQLKQLPTELRNASADEAGEVMMDVEIVAALCPEATINVYFASFDQKGWVDLLDHAISGANDVPVSLSISWGMAEDAPDWSAAALAAINERMHIAAMHGVTVCVASGDDGSGDGMSGKSAHVDFPASSPFVLGVGGTQLNSHGETTWWVSPGRRNGKGAGATGGGVSVKFARPSWQTVDVESVNTAAIDGRVVPDVAALAGDPGYDLVFFGHDAPNGGTSASAPLWASLIARVNAALPAAKRQRFLTPLLYAGTPSLGSKVCREMTTGNNVSHPAPGKGYKAGPGYDACTGWGVPDGQKLLAELQK